MNKIMAVVVIGVLLIAGNVFAQANVNVGTAYGVGYGNFFAYEAVTVADTAIGLTASTYTSEAQVAFCTLETAEIRYRLDAGTPTSSVGHPLSPLQSITLMGYQIPKFKAIRTGAVSGSLKCSYGK